MSIAEHSFHPYNPYTVISISTPRQTYCAPCVIYFVLSEPRNNMLENHLEENEEIF